jgi:ribonuclease E/ribonuclease G
VVGLASGARLIFEPVRTLTAVDVDLGAAAERSGDALTVNLEASAALARHLRLRNLGGLVIVDFLNMKGKDQGRRLAEALRQAVAGDPAEVALVGPSRFGVVELARERRGPSLAKALGNPLERATDDLVRRLRQAAASGAGSLDIRASPAMVAELRRAADGKDIASWVGRRLAIDSEPGRGDADYVVATR